MADRPPEPPDDPSPAVPTPRVPVAPRNSALKAAGGGVVGLLGGTLTGFVLGLVAVGLASAGQGNTVLTRLALLAPMGLGIVGVFVLFRPAGRRFWAAGGPFVQGLVIGSVLGYFGLAVACSALAFQQP